MFSCVAAVTGETDFVSDGDNHVRITGGTPMLARITATGCMASVLCAAFLATMKEEPVLAAACGIRAMDCAGELAAGLCGDKGPGSFHAAIFDAVAALR